MSAAAASSSSSSASSNENWNLDVKFQGRSIALVGRLPAEKRSFLREFPKKLNVNTKAKLSAIPQKGFFCKFFAKHCEEMKLYMKKNECALCVQFTALTYNFTLYLIVPVSLRGLKCLSRLRKSGASKESIKSLCTDRDGVVIGFIVSEVNPELEHKRQERQQVMQELASTAKAISSTFGDPMLEFDLLIDQLDTKPSAIHVCSKFIVRHQQLHEQIRQKLCDTMTALDNAKAKSNILYVVHDVIKSIRGGFPQPERNAKMRESPLVISLEKALHHLVSQLPDDAKQSSGVRGVLDFWKKWGLDYVTPVAEDKESNALDRDATIAKIDESFEILEKEALMSDASSSPIKQSASAEVVAFMKKHNIQPGPWELYLGEASAQEMEELDTAIDHNARYLKLNCWNAAETGGRRSGEGFLYHYVKSNHPDLLQLSAKRKSHKRRRPKDALAILREAFLCTWDLDQAAQRAVMDVEESILDDVWKKMEAVKCLNASAFVFGKIRKIKTDQYAKNPEIDAIMQLVADEKQLKEQSLIAEMVKVFKLDSMATEALNKVPSKSDLCRIAKELCDRCKERMVANASVHIIKLCHEASAATNPMKAYSNVMKSMMARQMKLSSFFSADAKKRRKVERASASPSPESDGASPQSSDLTDAELAAVKKRIPKPPKLLFKKVDLSTITYRESNDNGTVGVAMSGIPNAGRGLFNLSDHPWPAFSVVCIFGARRITKEMHHDGLNKVARCGELGETFVVVNGVVRDVEKFQMQYGHRLVPFDGLVDAEGSVGGMPNDRVYEYPADIYWDASSFYNNCILVPGCVLENPQDTTSPIMLNQLYIVTWKEVAVREEFFLAYGTSYYEDDDPKKKGVRGIN